MAIIPQQAVIAAWADLKPDFANELKGSLPNHQASIRDVGLCKLGSARGTSWAPKGPARLELSELSIARFEGLTTQAATFSDPTAARLPLGFSILEVKGKYRIQANCVLIGMFGMEMSKQEESASGNLTETFARSSLIYTAKVGANLSITGVEIPGDPKVEVTCDSGLPPWLQQLAVVISGSDLQTNIRNQLGSIFTTASFAQTMIAKLNKKLGV
ncbi:MAG: hypothetical protein WA510_13985 [Acidobacteriaceae bacterium]|jgi:hypothetical protein